MYIKKELILRYCLIGFLHIVYCNHSYASRFETDPVKDIIQNVSGDVHSMYNQDSNILEIGKEYDDLVKSESGKVFNYRVNFNVKDLSDINSFKLSNAGYKDHIIVKLNGSLVWSSNGLDRFSLEYSNRFKEEIKGEKFEFYGLGGKSVETWDWHKNSPNIEARNFLRSGSNQVSIELAIGKQGGFNIGFLASQKADKEVKCVDGPRRCEKSGDNIVEGVKVSRPCWRYSYVKTCDYPSKNDCYKYAHCTLVSDRECLLYDKYRNCVNLKREMSCEKPRSDNYEVDVVGFDDNDKRAPTRLICTNFPCIDGSCVNQTSKPNAEMMESLSKLSAVSKVKGGNMEVRIFEGKEKYCNNTRLLAYHDCCKIKGWGKFLGARCSSEEEDLINLRKANKCIYVGKRDSKLLGIVTTVTRNGWCCFNTVLDKLVQEQGRAQLGMNFGTGNDLDCRGLTIGEILKLNFNKMDFSDFYAEILKKTKIPEIKDMDQKIKDALPDIKTYDKSKTDYENQRSGINNCSNVGDTNYGN